MEKITVIHSVTTKTSEDYLWIEEFKQKKNTKFYFCKLVLFAMYIPIYLLKTKQVIYIVVQNSLFLFHKKKRWMKKSYQAEKEHLDAVFIFQSGKRWWYI
jgi:hypothetical protein